LLLRQQLPGNTALNAMKLPVIEGVIERRILANYRVRPDLLAG
jgi:hypothetical protein